MKLIPQHVILQSPAVNDPLLDLNTQPSLDLQFATSKTLNDRVSGLPLFDYERDAGSSNSPGTYVDSNGLIKTTPVNLLTYSEEFDQANWVNRRTTDSITIETLDPQGGSTATKLVDSIDNNTHRLDKTSLSLSGSTSYVFSCWLKAAEYSHASLSIAENSNFVISFKGVVFDLSAGVVSSESAGYTGSIESFTNGWYRCTASVTLPSSPTVQQVLIGLAQDATTGSFVGTGTSGIYIWGAQLEEGTTATDYIPTTSTISAAPRFDYDPVTGESLGLLIEEERTNIQEYSVLSTSNGWSPSRLTITANQETAPDNSSSAALVTEDTTNNVRFFIGSTYSFTSGKTYCNSMFFKAGTLDFVQVTLPSAAFGVSQYANFDLTNGVVTTEVNGTAFIESYQNGWYRCSFAAVANTTASTRPGIAFINSATAGRVPSYVGSSKTLYAWGAQVEEGSFPTSYIPTEGSTATRAADVLTSALGFDSWFTQNTGTVFVEASLKSPAASGQAPIVSVDNSGAGFRGISRRKNLGVRNTSNNDLIEVTGPLWNGEKKKIAATWVPNDCALVDNGVLVGTDTSTNSPLTTVNQMRIGRVVGGGFLAYMGGHIKRLVYYPYRLPDATLQEITS